MEKMTDFEKEQYKKRHIHYLKSLYQEQVKTNEMLTSINKYLRFFFWFVVFSVIVSIVNSIL